MEGLEQYGLLRANDIKIVRTESSTQQQHYIIKIKIHSSCEIEDFVETPIYSIIMSTIRSTHVMRSSETTNVNVKTYHIYIPSHLSPQNNV